MPGEIFKRKIYERMLRWKEESDGQTALLIKGARRIGKSTIAEEFARREYKSHIIIDFSIADNAVKELFSHISDLNYFFLLSRKDKICPIEVKSSGYNSHKSLDKFQQKFSERILRRYLLYTKDLRKDKDIFCLPAYMTGLL